jgi:hypothetical protein
MTDSTFATGGCRCGSITLRIANEPKLMAQCHCSDCQKATGTGHVSAAFFADEDVTVSGDAKGYTVTADSGNQSTRYFCPDCGSRLYGNNTGRPGITSIAVGCLDDHSWYSPGAVVYTKRRQDWDHTSTDIANFDAMPPPPPAR